MFFFNCICTESWYIQCYRHDICSSLFLNGQIFRIVCNSRVGFLLHRNKRTFEILMGHDNCKWREFFSSSWQLKLWKKMPYTLSFLGSTNWRCKCACTRSFRLGWPRLPYPLTTSQSWPWLARQFPSFRLVKTAEISPRLLYDGEVCLLFTFGSIYTPHLFTVKVCLQVHSHSPSNWMRIFQNLRCLRHTQYKFAVTLRAYNFSNYSEVWGQSSWQDYDKHILVLCPAGCVWPTSFI